jgi:hypothetical protein
LPMFFEDFLIAAMQRTNIVQGPQYSSLM